MNFDQWYFNFDETNRVATAQDGWNACKKEIIKIIAKHEKETYWITLDWKEQDWIKKIKEL
jgi:hypothetical protein